MSKLQQEVCSPDTYLFRVVLFYISQTLQLHLTLDEV